VFQPVTGDQKQRRAAQQSADGEMDEIDQLRHVSIVCSATKCSCATVLMETGILPRSRRVTDSIRQGRSA
jgi:hypothetical protein